MKWNSLAIALILLTFPVQAQQSLDLLGSPPASDFLTRHLDTKDTEIKPGSLALTGTEIDALIFPSPEKTRRFPSFEKFTGNETTALEFSRVQLFAHQAQLRVIGDDGESALAPDPRHVYIATNASTGIGFAVDIVSGEVRGFVNKFGAKLEISGNIIGQLEFASVEDAGSSECGTNLADQPIDILQDIASNPLMSASAAEAGGVISYDAVVAVETDNEWMDGFNDDPVAAMTWITDIFLAMNVFYERDVETRLLIGDVTLRTAPDPYSVPSNRSDQLDEFGEYWMNNMGHIDRQFAAMFSGRNISSYGFSGIAWVDAYCDYGSSWAGRTPGSYSYNAIGYNRTPANTAIFVGHELGHNMGSPHTHCYNPPVDSCYNAGGNGCYSGTPVCPAGGKGTVMSYCHVGGGNGAGCGISDSEFHPTVQSLLEGNLAAELAAGCILPHVEQTSEPEFDSTPVAGTTLDFGSHEVGNTSPTIPVQVDNIGTADLTLGCSLSGADSASFTIEACASPVTPAATTNVTVSCTPLASGALSASLDMTTNDVDESAVSFGLVCNGTDPPGNNMIFSGGFED